ncbi:tyrosine-type recombinase/integrase [Sphingopyxis sp. SCN 67-31]|uniref:site-specific integrase n=1 Tax=Sphingopyxis sp. SCN 67-31 TaxID=1660142 RepID=UPI0025798E69|nr:tyrosine-type recombinase/integrase [Sphingopyxis sp. SCN 67-31]
MPKGNDLPHVKHVRSKGRDYYYFDTGVRNERGKRIFNRLPDIKAADFGAVYAAMKAGVTRRVDVSPLLTVGSLIRHYERSPEFSRLSDGTQRTYGYALRKIEAQMARAPVDDVEPRDLSVLLAKLGNAAGSVNLTRSVMAALYKWGRNNHLVKATTDPVGDREAVPMGSHEPWPVAILDAALTCELPRVKLAVHLLYYTAQRIGDVCAMRWGDIRDETISVVQRKTGRALTIQMHQSLSDMLAATPKRGLTILTRADGGPVGDDAIRKEIQSFTAKYGARLVPHGLRKNAVIALLEAGCSVAETAAVSGQSFAMVEYYAKQRDQKILSSAAVLKWQERK